mmetsp:Transcript_15101/g.14502  ORF Transcript_15101/g.14502 Transcript_15101/m.14502 type:complete len:149 (-) Transcript_15101:1016-1462(-)
MNIDIKNPSAITATGVLYVRLNRIHGSANPTVISKTFDPIEEDTALSPRPFLATMTAASISGTEVPAAKNVRPIITDGIPSVAPIISTQLTMKYDKNPIHTREAINDCIAYGLLPSFLTSTIVLMKVKYKGSVSRYQNHAKYPAPAIG